MCLLSQSTAKPAARLTKCSSNTSRFPFRKTCPILKHMKINQKGFVVAIIVLAIAVLLGVGYFVFVNNSETVIEEQSSLPVTTETKTPAPLTTTTTTNETAEWKTYTNTQYGFSVSFPPQTSAIDGKADFVQKFPDAPAINNYERFCD